ncbi:MAG TPA: DUF1801 domain-containing protein [Candidatus Saccharibacteria bacterium]|nr:DUF1801 domain-containing protein [Candidatus Saccharibacteria bacterium]
MAELKTKVNDGSVEDFIGSVENEKRRADGFVLLEIYKRATKQQPKLWGTSIVGFGMYHYKSERSSQEGDWPLAAFSPRKQNLTLYVYPNNFPDLLKDLGKHKTGGSCLYINKIEDVDSKKLEVLVAASYKWAKENLGPKT